MNNLKSFLKKWNIYQKERFPIVIHCILILAFSSSAVSFSALSNHSLSAFPSYIVAFISCFLFFLQLRIADEFKDYEEDCLYRSYRPIPRGIIKLKELKVLFIIASVLQFLIVSTFNIKILPILIITWAYLFLMSHEFGVKKWLKAHPVIYLLSHMLIMPLIDLFSTSTDWINRLNPAIDPLILFIMVSFFNGINLELGRKIRNPQDEENGVETYSFLWGKKKACIAWLFSILFTGIAAIACAFYINKIFFEIMICFVSLYILVSLFFILFFLKNRRDKAGKTFEKLSGMFTLFIYLLLGLVPYFFTHWR